MGFTPSVFGTDAIPVRRLFQIVKGRWSGAGRHLFVLLWNVPPILRN